MSRIQPSRRDRRHTLDVGRPRRRSQRSRGQSLVEFAVVLPVFLLILAGVIDFGLGLYSQMTVINAAREGARLGVVSQPFDATAVNDRVVAMTAGLDQSNLNVTTTCKHPDGSSVACSATGSRGRDPGQGRLRLPHAVASGLRQHDRPLVDREDADRVGARHERGEHIEGEPDVGATGPTPARARPDHDPVRPGPDRDHGLRRHGHRCRRPAERQPEPVECARCRRSRRRTGAASRRIECADHRPCLCRQELSGRPAARRHRRVPLHHRQRRRLATIERRPGHLRSGRKCLLDVQRQDLQLGLHPGRGRHL